MRVKTLKIFSIVAVMLAIATTASCDSCASKLTGLFTSYQATKLCLLPYNLTHNITFDGTVFIGANTTDGSDTGLIAITGGSLNPNIAHGAYLWLYGNEYSGSTKGDWYLRSGDVASSGGYGHLSGRLGIKFQRNEAGYIDLWTLDTVTGTWTSDATGGGDIVFSKPGTGLQLAEGGAGADCMGTVTANGSSDVTTSTTCATTGARILLTRTSALAANLAEAFVKSISSGVSFTINAVASNTSTYNWFIIRKSS